VVNKSNDGLITWFNDYMVHIVI